MRNRDSITFLVMKTLVAYFLPCLLLLVCSCSPITGVSYDYDREVDLNSLKSYDWVAIPKEAEEKERLMIERIKKAVNSHLEARGFISKKERPGFLIATTYGSEEKIQIWSSGFGYGRPYYGYNYGPYPTGIVTSYYYEEGTLVLDFLDGDSGKLVWRGMAKASLGKAFNPEKLDRLVNEAVEKILANFPPAPSK